MEDEITRSQAKVPAKKPPRERKKRSLVWVDYEVSRNGDGKKIANCKKCRQEFVAESTDGTNHLRRHLKTCPRREDGAPPPFAAPPTIPAAPSIGAPPEASNCGNPAILAIPAPPPIDEAVPESSNCGMPADWEEATADLARMIGLHGYDPSIVEDTYFKSFVRRLNPDFQVPSRAAIEDICDGVQDDEVLKSVLDDAQRVLKTCPRREDGAPPPIAAPPTVPATPPIAIAAPPEASNCGNPADLVAANADLGNPAPPIIDEARPESSNCRKTAGWEEATADLARMIALHGYDPSVVEDSYFRSFMRRLNPDFQVPSRAAIEDICDGVYDDADRVLGWALTQNYSTEVNLVIDKTETALGPVIYAACHFIDDDWNRRQMIVHVSMDLPEDMCPLPKFVRGYNRHKLLHAEDWRDKMFKDFLDIWDGGVFSKMTGPIPGISTKCFVHTRYETTYNPYDVLQMVASCLDDDVILECLKETIDKYGFALRSVTRQERERLYSQHGLGYLLSYDKNWYSWYCTLRILQEYDSSFISTSTTLSELMCRVWGEIYRAIQTISDPKHPTSHIVLRELFKVRETLQYEIAHYSDSDTNLDVALVLVKAEDTLLRRIRGNYLQWSIPLVLDPRYKLKYIKFLFSRAFSSEAEEYIFEITITFKRLLDYFSTDDEEDHIHGTEMISSGHRLEQAWGEHRRHSKVTKTELDRYLEGPLIDETDGFDILSWWKLNSSIYPTLAKIARAALAMPTCGKLSSEQMSQITSKIRGYSKYKLEYRA